MPKLECSICGGDIFQEWPELVAEWQLASYESDYIDRQQGCVCISCGANLRIIALGNAIRSVAGTLLPLRHSVAAGQFAGWRILDCNGTEGMSAVLSVLPTYCRADYPEYDMRRLPYPDGSFDLVIHSDTLEHVEHPVVALQECRRVLAPGGRLCFTTPIITGRLTRDRAGLAPSYHGDPTTGRDDYIVHTEFGADAWTFVHQAGFTNLMLNQIEFPSGIAITAWIEPSITSPLGEAAPTA